MSQNNNTIYQKLTRMLGYNVKQTAKPQQQSFNFNKDELLKTDSREEYEKNLLQAQQSQYITDKWAKVDQSLYNQSVYYEPNRLSAYYDFESMEFSLGGDTKIATPNGFITIKELAEKGRDYEFVVYAYDHNLKKVVPAIARNAHYTRNEMTYKITFDDGNYLIATHGHRLLKRDGTFEVVENLKKGDSMMPFYRKAINNENHVYICDSNNEWINENELVNNWTNEIIKNDFDKIINVAKKYKTIEKTAIELNITIEKLSEILILNGFRSWSDFLRIYKISSDNNTTEKFDIIPWDLIIDYSRKYNTMTETSRKLGVNVNKLKSTLKMGGFNNWKTFIKTYNKNKKSNKSLINHKIVSIEPNCIEPVYDLTVPGYKNFATDTIFSHNTPEISAALDIFSEESCTMSEKGEILTIFSESERIRDVLYDLFNNKLDINTNIQMWTRGMCKYGDNFVYLKIDPNQGIVGCQQLPNIEIERNEGNSLTTPNIDNTDLQTRETRFLWKNKNMEFQSWEIAHFRLLGDDRKLPYGTSILDKIRRIWKQLLLAEDAMLIYRTSRAPERRVFKVFVGNMDDKDIEPYVQRVASKFKRDQVVDSRNGQVDMRYNQMAVDQDYFIPVRDISQTNPIETLPGACISLDTEIPLLDGRTLKLKEIIDEWDNGNKDLWVYSANPLTGELAPGLITWAGITRKNTDVLKITLDNGEEIITTPDHKFVHRTNGFVEAKDLNIGDSLMPFYTKYEKINRKTNTYQKIWDSYKQEWVFTHRMVSEFLKNHDIIKEMVYDENYINLDKKIIHHKNHNRYDNNPLNLVKMSGIDHMKYHQSVIKETIWKDKDLNKEKISKGLKKYIKNLSEEQKRERYKKNISSDNSNKITTKKLLEWRKNDDNNKKVGLLISKAYTDERKKKLSLNNIENWKNDDYKQKVFSKNQIITFSDEIYNKFLKVFETNLRADKTLEILNNDLEFISLFKSLNKDIRSSLTNLNEFTLNHVNKMLKQVGYKNFSEWKKNELKKRGFKNMVAWKYTVNKQNKLYNHKITNIEYLEEKLDTGTITVDNSEIYHNYHTFAIKSGVFIKNSNLSEIADIEYIQKKLVAALRIPKAFLGFEEVVGEGKGLALMDIRFARTINKVQKSIIQELNKIALIHLMILGFEDEMSNFNLSLTNPSAQSDLLKLEQWKEKIAIYKDATSDQSQLGILPVSHTWAKKNILGMTESEVILDLQQQRLERAIGFELQNTQQIIRRTGVFDNVDTKYGIPEEEREKLEKQPVEGGGDVLGGTTDTSSAGALGENKNILSEMLNKNSAENIINDMKNKIDELIKS